MDPKQEKKMTDDIKALLKKYPTLVAADDVFRHKNYIILTRGGIQKIRNASNIDVRYEVIPVATDHIIVLATATKDNITLQTTGSAKYGGKDFVTVPGQDKKKFVQYGNTESWYLSEIAEKRAMSRAVLSMENLYEEGVFGEDESDDFTKANDKSITPKVPKVEKPNKEEVKAIIESDEEYKQRVVKLEGEPTIPKVEKSKSDYKGPETAIAELEKSTTMEELIANWGIINSWGFGSHPTVVAKKDELKIKFQ